MKEHTHSDSLPGDQKFKQDRSPLMNWSLKTIDQSPNGRRLVLAGCLTPPALAFLLTLWSLHTGMEDDYDFWSRLSPGVLVAALAFLAMLRQKTLFNYRIYADHAEVDYCHYFPKYTGKLFKSIILLFIFLLATTAIYTSSWMTLIFGPFVILMGAGGSLLVWEQPTPSQALSFPWVEHDFVTVDRKYRIVVTHRKELTEGFDFRFPNDELMEHFLEFLRTTLPPTVQYKEEVWKW